MVSISDSFNCIKTCLVQSLDLGSLGLFFDEIANLALGRITDNESIYSLHLSPKDWGEGYINSNLPGSKKPSLSLSPFAVNASPESYMKLLLSSIHLSPPPRK